MAGYMSNDQRKWILKEYWKTGNCERVRERWREEFDAPPPTRLSICRLRDKFNNTGSICNASKAGRPVTITTPENEMTVAQTYVQSPKKSKKRASIELGIERRSLGRLMKRLRLKMYIPRLTHGLLEDDPDRRLQFCEIMLNEELHGTGIISKIVWSDEAHFKLSGAVNRYNCVYYSPDNLHVTIEEQLNQPGVTVWASLSCKGVIGPVIFHNSVDQHAYMNMLTDVIPQIKIQQGHDVFYFQQDGAPAHYATIVRDLLNREFPNTWIGRRGSVEWPARSPDLTPMDFFFWGVVKEKVFSKKPLDVNQMVEFIRQACQDIDENKELCRKVCLSVNSRLQQCIDCEGKQFEHRRK